MSIKLYLFLFLCLIGPIFSQTSLSSDQDDFIDILTAILQNKEILSHNPNQLSTFACWQGAFWDTKPYFDFPAKQGLVLEYWSEKLRTSFDTWSIVLQTFNDNYIDQGGIIIEIHPQIFGENIEINQDNATVRFPKAAVYLSDYPDQVTTLYCQSDVYIYFIEKSTQLPPQTFDTTNLQAYTKQVRIIDNNCGFEIITSFFDDSFEVSLFDKVIFIIGSIVYLIASLLSRYTHQPNKRKVSVGSLRLLMFFSYYMICYMIMWLSTIYMGSDLLDLFIPCVIAILVDFIKHSRELSKNDNLCCGCVLFGPLPAFILVAIPDIGIYLGNLLSCLYLLPQVLMKYKERHERQKHLTGFEIGNWVCITLWVAYLDLYPDNVFLSSPKPVLFFLHFTATLIQLSVLVYLEYGVPRKKGFKYTFMVDESVNKEKLIEEEQCAICIEGFEVNSKEKLYKTPCGHFFHSSCLKAWGGKKLQCPCCRKKIPDFAYPVD